MGSMKADTVAVCWDDLKVAGTVELTVENLAALKVELKAGLMAVWKVEHLGSKLAAQKDGCMVGDSVGHCL